MPYHREMERRKFFSDLIFVQGLNLLIKIVWILVIDRAVQNLLDDYGLYYRLLSLTILFVIALDLGINNMNSRLVAQDQRYFNTNFGSFMRSKLFLSIFYLSLIFLGGLVLDLTAPQWAVLGTLALFQVINSFNLYFRSNISAMHAFKLDGLLAVADRLLVIVVCGIWLYVPGFEEMLTIRNFALVQLGGVFATFCIALTINLTRLDRKETLEMSEKVRGILKSSLPYALLIALMAIFTRVDAIMIGQFLNDTETDRYAMSYRLLDAANMMAALFSGMLLPMFSRILNKKNEVADLAGIAARVMVVPALLMALVLAPHATEVMGMMYPNKQELISGGTFIWLLFSFVASASVYIFGTLLTAAGRMRDLNRIALISAVGNVILNIWLIPQLGIAGAAIATFATQLFFAVECFRHSYTSFKFQPQQRLVLKFSLALALFIAVYYISLQFFGNHLVHIFVGVILSVLLVVGSGLIGTDVLKKLSRRKTQEASDN